MFVIYGSCPVGTCLTSCYTSCMLQVLCAPIPVVDSASVVHVSSGFVAFERGLVYAACVIPLTRETMGNQSSAEFCKATLAAIYRNLFLIVLYVPAAVLR